MRVLVSGGSGFIGTPLMELLSRSDNDVLVITRAVVAAKSSNIRWLNADLNDESTYRAGVAKFAPEVVIHLAWEGIPDFSLEMSLRNLNSSVCLASAAISGGSCSKILVAGSAFEVSSIQGACSEESIAIPKDHFTWAKHALKSWLEMESVKHKISIGWFRVFYAYGPEQREASLIPTILRSLSSGETPDIRSPLNANDFVYVDDVANAFIKATTTEFPTGTYNLGSGVATSILDVCKTAEKIVGEVGHAEKLSHKKTGAPAAAFWAETKRTQSILNWKPKVSLEEGIAKTWLAIRKK